MGEMAKKIVKIERNVVIIHQALQEFVGIHLIMLGVLEEQLRVNALQHIEKILKKLKKL